MKKIIKTLKKFWFTHIKQERIYTVLVRGRIKEKNKKFLSLHGKRYIKNLKDLENFFERKDAFPVLEIGFGDGKHLAQKATQEKEKDFWGVELYSLGIILAAKKLFTGDIQNVSLLETDARLVVQKSPPLFWKEIYVLFPDPWRKKKHFKRRILKEDFIKSLMRALSPQGKIVLATDWGSYQDEVRETLAQIQRGDSSHTFSFRESFYSKKEGGPQKLILETSFAERAFREGRGVSIFEIYRN